MKKDWIIRAIALLESSLVPLPQELSELDWKERLSPNNDKLSKHLSAMANNPGGGFLAFGIENATGRVIGIEKVHSDDTMERISNLARDALMPAVRVDFAIETYRGFPVLLVHILESPEKPVCLAGKSLEETYIRSGGSTRKASRHEVGGLMLNSKLPQFEELNCSALKSDEQVLELLDYQAIFDLLGKPVSKDKVEVLKSMRNEKMVNASDGNRFYITNFGALAAAKDLSEFDGLVRKGIRLIQYDGDNKIRTKREYPGSKGYAIGFSALVNFVMGLLPGSEVIESALRKQTTVYPEIALRELIANALIHQDFSIKGAGPMIEIFDNRIEITNPGKLLPSKKIDRLIGATPESRNEILASAFRRYKICEERGSGLQKAVAAIELFGLPPLDFHEGENSFKVTIQSPKKFGMMTTEERIEAAYQHSVLKFYSHSALTNTSLRERFKMSEKQRAQVSLVIREAIEKGKIKQKDPNNSSLKFAEYIPYWA